VRIAICDYSGHPFQVELSRGLARRNHAVLHLHFAEFPTPKGNLAVLPSDPSSFQVEAVSLGRTFDKSRFFWRRFIEAKAGALFAARVAKFSPDIVVGCNLPLDAQRKLARHCQRNGISFVFWLQDIYSEGIRHYLRAKFGILGELIGRYYGRLEGSLLRSADAVVPISAKFASALDGWAVDQDRVHVIPNWAPLSEIYPVQKANAWARQRGLENRIVALYTGTLGLKHDPALLLHVARTCGEHGVVVVVVSEGAGAQWLAEQSQKLGVANVMVLPFQPMELYPQVLGAGDVLVAMIGKEAAGFSIPSKILSYLAAGKPIVASISEDNDAAQMIKAAESGVVVTPGDAEALSKAVLTLARDRDRRDRLGRNARAFAERTFEIERITDRFEGIFARICARRTSGKSLPLGQAVEGKV
jgi:glycosyltransferase involved in cell wall biosynthesis